MIANIGTTDIRVKIDITPCKSKGNRTLYDIYLIFRIYQNGIQTFRPLTISTGESVAVAGWDIYKKSMKGNNDTANAFNTRMSEYRNNARNNLTDNFARKENIACSEVVAYIKTSLKTKLTGKAPRGQKEEYQLRQTKNSIEYVMDDLFEKQKQAKGRQRQYRFVVNNLIHPFFKHDTPLITDITEKHLQDFTVWFRDNYRISRGKRKGQSPKQNSVTTWFSMIGSIFVHATRNMKILPQLPLPKSFRGAYEEAERVVLSESECMDIINLHDHDLSKAKQRAKYCLLLELLTGIQYCDLKALTREHVKFDKDYRQWYIKKNREKTGETFTIFLTPRAQHCYERLQGLARGENTIFNLPTIDCMNGHYKDLAKMAGVTKGVTTYILRHTFAVDNLDNHTPIEDIQVMLGHKDLRTTQIYAKVSRQRLHGNTKILTERSKMHQL